MKTLALMLVVATSLTGCTNLARDVRRDCQSISHKTSWSAPMTFTSEWVFQLRPLTPSKK